MVRAAAVVAAVVVGVSLGAVGVAGGVGTRGAPPSGDPAAAWAAGPAGEPDEPATGAATGAATTGAAGPTWPLGVDAPPALRPAAPRSAPDDAAPIRTFALPLPAPVVVLRPFDGPARPWAPGHRGVDLAARPGQPVHAPGPGVVTFAGTVVDRGVLTVTHDDGLRSSLEPVAASVGVGQRVVRGQVVGSVGAEPGHCAPATCLHWGLRRGEEYLDPMRWVLGRGPVVLLPRG